MRLHQNKEVFKEIVSLAADHFGLRDYQVEKDYYVSLLLKELSKNNEIKLVFKGGTSLSKCYKVIDRFSEDIDLAILSDNSNVNQGTKRKLKDLILFSIDNIEMKLINPDEIKSRRDFNSYLIKFEQLFTPGLDAVSDIVVETLVAYKPYPAKVSQVNNFVTSYLIEINRQDLIDIFELHPFSMLIQSIERTFIDKIFALCDYHLFQKYDRYSRHLYDLHKIWKSGLLNLNTVLEIMPEVILDRQQYEERNPSCRTGTKPRKILDNIIQDDVYKNDYQTITNKLIYKAVPYQKCIESLREIINGDFIPKTIK